MRPPRNPFRLRAAEQIEDAWTFVSLYEPGFLAYLPSEGLWDRRVIVRSAPGGGKTTLLRVFTPGPLRHVHTQGRDKALREVRSALGDRGAIDRSGPLVAGALLSLAGKYAPLEQLAGLSEGQRVRTFLAMLNARVLLAALRAHLELRGLRYPDDLARISVKAPDADVSPGFVGLPAGGDAIYEWARTQETRVAAALSSLGPPDAEGLPGDEELSCLDVLGQGAVEIDAKPVRARTLVMFDDVHRLSVTQRAFLVDTLLARRTPTPVWLAERNEALTPKELLSSGAREERDEIIIEIERYWRRSRRAAFERHALRVADRRTVMAPETSAASFAAMLSGPDDHAYQRILDSVEERMRAATEGRLEFSSWIEAQTERYANARERAIAVRALEIRIRRELAAAQMSLDMFVREEAALEELEQKRHEASNVRDAAELFLCHEYELPYYYGGERLTQLASSNLDQFLDMAGDLFEELSGAAVLRRSSALSPVRQEQLVQDTVRAIWSRLGTSVENGGRIRALLDGIGEYAGERTYAPTAPYAPGVTGVALRLSQAEDLQRALREQPDSWEAELGRLLATLIAHNLVGVYPSEAKGQRWAVYYLNRALCVRYRLPLGLGGWQPVSPDTLHAWSKGDRVRSPQGRLAA